MKDDHSSPAPEETPQGLTRPEEQLYQRLPLCQYLSELPEIAEVGENSTSEEKD